MNSIPKYRPDQNIKNCDKEKIENKVNDWLKCVKVYQNVKETKEK